MEFIKSVNVYCAPTMSQMLYDDGCYTLVNNTGTVLALTRLIIEGVRTGLRCFNPTAELRRTR